MNKSIDQFQDIIDQRLSTTCTDVMQEMLSVLRIAMLRISASPDERPDAEQLQKVLLDLSTSPLGYLSL